MVFSSVTTVWLLDIMSNTPWKDKTTHNNIMREVSSVFGTDLNGTLVKDSRHNCLAEWVLNETGCATSRLSTDIEPFHIPTSSSISLAAGESENNRAEHNTMTGYWQWPYSAIISSCGYFIFPTGSLDCHSINAIQRCTDKPQIKVPKLRCFHCAIPSWHHIKIHHFRSFYILLHTFK